MASLLFRQIGRKRPLTPSLSSSSSSVSSIYRFYRFLSTSSDVISKGTSQHAEHCVDLVKKHDFDLYLCGLLMPTQARRAFFALRAFNVETGLIKDISRGNALPGQMRMQWWREVVASIYKDKPPNHPVALALAEDALKKISFILILPFSLIYTQHAAVKTHGLTRRWLDRVLEARMKDLDNIQPTTMADLEEYAENTASSLLYLTLEAMDIRDTTADHAASHVGKATGIVTILRGTKYHADSGSLYIPLELQREYKVSANDILKALAPFTGPQFTETAQALHDVFYEIASHAHLHMEHTREMIAFTYLPTYKGPQSAEAAQALHDVLYEVRPQSAEAAQALHDVFYEIASHAHLHLEHAREMIPSSPKGAATALLPGVRTKTYLDALQKAQFNVLDQELLPKSHFTYQLKLLWTNWTGKI